MQVVAQSKEAVKNVLYGVCPSVDNQYSTRVCSGVSFQETLRATGRSHETRTHTGDVRRSPALYARLCDDTTLTQYTDY